jgi:hypothetical protein
MVGARASAHPDYACSAISSPAVLCMMFRAASPLGQVCGG